MIWNGHEPLARERRALRAHLAAAVREACAGSGIDHHYIDDVADGVAVFCLKENHPQGVPSDYLRLLVSRALDAVGPSGAAESLLSHASKSAKPLDGFLPLLTQSSASAARLCALCAGQVVRPSFWATYQDTTTWVVDLSRLKPPDGVTLELELFTCLRAMLKSLSALWEETDGRGVLGLDGLEAVSSPLGPGPRGKRAGPGAGEVVDYCRSFLKQEGHRRGWPRSPTVIALELPVRGRN